MAVTEKKYLDLEGLRTYTRKNKEFVEGKIDDVNNRIDALTNLQATVDASAFTITTDIISSGSTASGKIPTEGAVAMTINDLDVAYIEPASSAVTGFDEYFDQVFRENEGEPTDSGSTTGSRWARFNYNEATRNAANEAALNAAETLTSLEQKVEELITKVNRIEGTLAQ